MKKQHLLIISILVCILLSLLIMPTVMAADSIKGGVGDIGQKIYGSSPPTQHPARTIGFILQGLLAFVGIIFFAMVVYGGFLYMTSGGKEDKIKKGKNYVIYSALGIFIILLAYAITRFVAGVIINAQFGYT